MQIKFIKLTLVCKESIEEIDLDHQINIFYGKISAGKSTIARLIDFIFGGNLEKTPAIQSQMIKAKLLLKIKRYEISLERGIENNYVNVTWLIDGDGYNLNAPIKTALNPIFQDNIFNLSDLFFYFLGITPPKMKISKLEEDSSLVRLSIRNFMWFCYLEQSELDSNFYNLLTPILKESSKEILRFVIGDYSQVLNDLQLQLMDTRDKRMAKVEAINQIKSFLFNYGFQTDTEIKDEIANLKTELNNIIKEKKSFEESNIVNNHPVDDIKNELRALSNLISEQETALENIEENIQKQKELKSEYITSKMKLFKKNAASDIFEKVAFNLCPACGLTLKGNVQLNDHCYLCGQPKDPSNSSAKVDVSDKDIEDKIKELEVSTSNHLREKYKLVRNLEKNKSIKKEKDLKLSEMLKDYDSLMLSKAKDFEYRMGTINERTRNLENLLKLPDTINGLYSEVDELFQLEEKLKRGIKDEKSSFVEAEKNISLLEDYYLESLIESKFPGITSNHRIQINRTTWIPDVVEPESSNTWNFYDAGSGGKKTLLNVLFAVAFHRLAIEKKLPLPTFLIIDSPMKNIDKTVNEDVFKSFYNYLFNLASGSIKDIQLIIIDNDYFSSKVKELDISTRKMTSDDEKNPPLISYYRGS